MTTYKVELIVENEGDFPLNEGDILEYFEFSDTPTQIRVKSARIEPTEEVADGE
jgi:hypothetical protein